MSTFDVERPRRLLFGLLAVACLLLGAASCSSDDGADDPQSAMELTPSSDEVGGSDDPDGSDGADSGAGSGSGDDDTDAGGSGAGEGVGSEVGPVEPLDLTSEEEAYRDDLLAAVDLDDSDAGFDMECLAGRWIRSAGLERLNADGVTPQALAEEGPTAIELSRDEALEFVRDYERCGMDLHDFILPADLDSATRTCITEALDRGDLEDYIVTAILGDDAGAAAMQDQIALSAADCTE